MPRTHSLKPALGQLRDMYGFYTDSYILRSQASKWKLGTTLQQKLGNFAMKWGKPKDALTVYLYFEYGEWDKEGYMIGAIKCRVLEQKLNWAHMSRRKRSLHYGKSVSSSNRYT